MKQEYLDGATRFHKMRHITIPSIMPIIITMFILKLGTVLNEVLIKY